MGRDNAGGRHQQPQGEHARLVAGTAADGAVHAHEPRCDAVSGDLHRFGDVDGAVDGRARHDVATVWLPFSNALARIDIAANEHGTTGVRESTVLALGLQTPGMPASSDDEFYDRDFPAHPLTLVRARLKVVLDTIECTSGSDLTPFRVAPKL